MEVHAYLGSRWWKFDFHNHTPASSDFDHAEINSLQPRDWLLAYMRKGIDCVAVTDHNGSDWIEKLQTALSDLNNEEPKPDGYWTLAIFPGVEITTSESLHVLAIFGPEEKKSVLDGLLVGKLNLSNLGRANAELMYCESASTVIDRIHELNGLAIAAHVEKSNGLLQGQTDESDAFSPKCTGRVIDGLLPKFDALEFQSLDNNCYRHFQSRIDHYSCVAGSDSHKIGNAGNRFTWVKMSIPSFDGLRLALLDPESALRRSDEKIDDFQPLPEQWIKSITLENMHLRRDGHGPLTLQFNPAYNAIIGGRGSGKSTVLECLRLALAREVELNKLGEDSEIWKTFDGFKREYVQRDKPGMMLSGTRITVEVVKGKAESGQLFQFVWSKQLDGRFATRVWRQDAGDWHPTGLDEKQAGALFPVKIFSQKQILALANNPQALLEYIDDSIREQKASWQQQFDERKTVLLAARLRVRTLKKELAKKPALELEYKEASRKARVFTNANFGPLLKAYQRASQQQRALNDFYQLLTSDVAGLQIGIGQAANLAATELTQFLVESPAEQAAQDSALALKKHLAAEYVRIESIVVAMQAQLDAAQTQLATSDWQRENVLHIQAYQQESVRLKAEGINSAQEAALAVASEERLRKQLEQIKVFENDLERAERSVDAAAQALTACRESLTEVRTVFIKSLFEQNGMLKVSLRSMASSRDAVGKLRQILRLPDSARFEDIWLEDESGQCSGLLWDMVDLATASTVGERLHSIKLDIEGKSKTILRTSLHGFLVKRLEALQDESYDELAWWFPEDEVLLEYRPGKTESYKNISLASAGQKTAAILSFLLVHGDEPLLLDQPEDDLDNALVSDLVVAQLRKNKKNRQLIVVTHNANIVVNGDAELVLTMNFVKGQINLKSVGGLQETAVRQDVCRVMEGGEEAFRQRYKRILQDLETRP